MACNLILKALFIIEACIFGLRPFITSNHMWKQMHASLNFQMMKPAKSLVMFRVIVRKKLLC